MLCHRWRVVGLSEHMERVDAVVIGAGVVGLAVARALALLEEALSDAESWWLLSPLRSACEQAAAGEPSHQELLSRALAQRVG